VVEYDVVRRYPNYCVHLEASHDWATIRNELVQDGRSDPLTARGVDNVVQDNIIEHCEDTSITMTGDYGMCLGNRSYGAGHNSLAISGKRPLISHNICRDHQRHNMVSITSGAMNLGDTPDALVVNNVASRNPRLERGKFGLFAVNGDENTEIQITLHNNQFLDFERGEFSAKESGAGIGDVIFSTDDN
jgi:hypothetical protein